MLFQLDAARAAHPKATTTPTYSWRQQRKPSCHHLQKQPRRNIWKSLITSSLTKTGKFHRLVIELLILNASLFYYIVLISHSLASFNRCIFLASLFAQWRTNKLFFHLYSTEFVGKQFVRYKDCSKFGRLLFSGKVYWLLEVCAETIFLLSDIPAGFRIVRNITVGLIAKFTKMCFQLEQIRCSTSCLRRNFLWAIQRTETEATLCHCHWSCFQVWFARCVFINWSWPHR